MPSRRAFTAVAACLLAPGLVSVWACKGDEAAPAEAAPVAKVEPANTLGESYQPLKEPLQGGPFPGVLLTQAWFWKDAQGKTRPGPARLEIWRKNGETWAMTTLEDGDSNVFHKAIAWEGGILTIGAEKALVKKWTFAGGAWTQDVLWERSWGGKFNRIRDVEVGDVDGDGKDELVLATHDAGVVAVLNPDVTGEGRVIELDQTADTFVHEIEIGDIDGDGKKEFFATPSDRNKVGVSQAGSMVMYRWDGSTYVRTVVDPMGTTHAKEILATDLDGDGRSELFSVLEAELGADKQVTQPVEIRQYTLQKDGTFTHRAISTLSDRQTRFLVAGDFDQDGQVELVAAAMKTGLWLLDPQPDGTWKSTNFETNSSGFEHSVFPADLDGDGALELYVASDEQRELRVYVWDKTNGRFAGKVVGTLPERSITWNITAGRF